MSPPKKKKAPASRRPGTVYLVGAGPGDPGLITRKGAELLEKAGAVVYDALVHPDLLEEAPPSAELHDVGRRAGSKRIDQTQLNRLLIELATRHDVVVRLKGGDPFVFGRGGEEAMALAEAGVPFEIVPGVTSGGAVPAYAGIPLTHRGVASSVTFLTGHQVYSPGEGGVERTVPLSDDGTLVVFMGLLRVGDIARGLMDRGVPPTTPVALIESGTYPAQRTVTGLLSDIADRARRIKITGPALIVVGRVVALRSSIRWFPERENSVGTLAGLTPGGGALIFRVVLTIRSIRTMSRECPR